MRLMQVLLAVKGGTRDPVPFQERLPLKLKPRVSGKAIATNEARCIQEMSVMLACLKKNDFAENLCSKEIDGFQKCYSSYLAGQEGRKERESLGILIPGEKKLSPKQVNTLLKKFPNLE